MNPVMLLKMRQTRKIAEIGEALRAAGILSLNAQAAVLGCTTYTVVCAEHKSTGLSAKIISQTLRSSRLPLPVRTKIEEYAKEKASGLYGTTKKQQRRFLSRLAEAA